jgi:O-antigen/teichoic acid export membrane protein
MLKNTLWNALGLIVPSLIAIPVMAVMARVLGVEKFGIFVLTFSVLGYAGVFDGGLTRAVIRAVAMNGDDETLNRDVIGTATYAVIALGTAGSLLVFLLARPIAGFLNVSAAALGDTIDALQMMALVIPAYLLSLVWFAYLEGKQQFMQLSVLKTFTGVLVAGLPAVAVLLRPTLSAALGGLLLARIVTMLAAYLPCRAGLKTSVFPFHRATLRALLQFGGWITVSNIISPVMSYVDRFILSNLLGAHRVAFYAAPSEMVTRMSVIPGAVSRTIFPLFSRRPGESRDTARSVSRGLLVVCTIVAIPIFIFSGWLLDVWLGAPYGAESAGILRILLVGFIFNALAQVPYSRIQAHGKSRATAFIHLCELVPYLALLTLLIREYGLIGAAVAWTVRVGVDLLVLQILSRRLVT